MPKKPGAKISPNSLANLELGRGQGHGRTLDYEQRKKKRGITVTDQGWNGLETLANQADVSVSEFLERVGRGLLTVMKTEQLEALEDRLDLEDCSRRLADPKEVPIAYDQVRQELGLA